MKCVYVAGPFRHASIDMPGQQDGWGIQRNIMAAADLALQVWRMGAAALCPHLNTAPFQGAANDRVWLAGDLALLERCDAILMVPGWRRSQGAQEEYRHARLKSIPVFEELADLAVWLGLPMQRAA